jgi:hypothetical protein
MAMALNMTSTRPPLTIAHQRQPRHSRIRGARGVKSPSQPPQVLLLTSVFEIGGNTGGHVAEKARRTDGVTEKPLVISLMSGLARLR